MYAIRMILNGFSLQIHLHSLQKIYGGLWESAPDRLDIQKSHDQFMDYIGLNPKNEY